MLFRSHPIAFVSKGLGPHTKGLSTYEKEYMAILMAVEQWRTYLQHAEFIIHTDHRSLAQLGEQRLHTPWQQKVFTKLLGLQFRIKYKKGSENRVADALSRRPQYEHSLLAISHHQPDWMLEVMELYKEHPQAVELLTSLSIAPDKGGKFTF